MEYAKDEFFKIQYNTKLNRLELKKERWTSKIYKKIKRHKFFITVVMAFFMFSTINIIMIFNFMKILCTYA